MQIKRSNRDDLYFALVIERHVQDKRQRRGLSVFFCRRSYPVAQQNDVEAADQFSLHRKTTPQLWVDAPQKLLDLGQANDLDGSVRGGGVADLIEYRRSHANR